MTRNQKLGLGLVAVIVAIGLFGRGSRQPTGTTTPGASAAAAADTPRVLASGGLACRSRATYFRIWPKVAGFMAGGGGYDSLVAWAHRHPGCRTLDPEGEPVERVELIGPQQVAVWLVGDSVPWFAHRLAIDTVP